MYDPRYIQYLNLPPIPEKIISTLVTDVAVHQQHTNASVYGSYTWSDYGTGELNRWCKDNISQELYYGIQFMTSHVPTHVDFGTEIKINYIVDAGGDNVVTNFYDVDQITLLESYKIECGRWHIFKASQPHEIVNITQTRISITARIF